MGKTYTTVQGDMWDSVAHAQMGNTSYTDKLMNLNREYREYFIFPAGITLTLPDPVIEAPGGAPPWRKAGVA